MKSGCYDALGEDYICNFFIIHLGFFTFTTDCMSLQQGQDVILSLLDTRDAMVRKCSHWLIYGTYIQWRF